MIIMVRPDLTNAPGIIKNYYAAGICVPEKFWKLVAEGMPYSELIDGEIVNIDAYNACRL